MIQVNNINNNIKSRTVLLIDENGKNIGNISKNEALNRAKDVGMDLVEVNKNNELSICRILDYGKWKYNQTKKVKSKTSVQPKQKVKEIRLSPNIGDNDIIYRAKRVEEFLKNGMKVKILVQFRGREQKHMFVTGQRILDKFISLLTHNFAVENNVQSEGNFIFLMLLPKIINGKVNDSNK